MQLTLIALLLAFALPAIAYPTGELTASEHKRRKDKESDTSNNVLTEKPYSEFQISSDTGGDCLAKVQTNFPIDESNLAGVSDEDLAIIKAAHQTAEQAELQKFNPAIQSAKGEDLAAIKVGKTSNKCLKLKLEILELQIKLAKGQGSQAKIDVEQKKLNHNVEVDQANAGQPSQSVEFDG